MFTADTNATYTVNPFDVTWTIQQADDDGDTGDTNPAPNPTPQPTPTPSPSPKPAPRGSGE